MLLEKTLTLIILPVVKSKPRTVQMLHFIYHCSSNQRHRQIINSLKYLETKTLGTKFKEYIIINIKVHELGITFVKEMIYRIRHFISLCM